METADIFLTIIAGLVSINLTATLKILYELGGLNARVTNLEEKSK